MTPGMFNGIGSVFLFLIGLALVVGVSIGRC